MHDDEIKPFVGQPVRVTLADGRILAGTLHAHGDQGHGHIHYAVVSDPIKKGGEHNNGAISGAPDKILKMQVEADVA